MIRINLLPHREEKRKQNMAAFYALLVLAGIIGLAIVLAVAGYLAAQISIQTQRNEFMKAENGKLDEKIKEIATLRQEIDSLEARQQAVEDLQSDRNQPVYLMDELAKQTPEGVYLRSIKQEAQQVELQGYAQSNERVSEFLRNLSNSSPWLERPDLKEIRSAGVGQGKDAKKVFDFRMRINIKRPRDKEKEPLPTASAKHPGVLPAQSATNAASTAPKKP